MRCLRRQMVLESRQTYTGENASNYSEQTSTETVLAAPKQMAELSRQKEMAEVNCFQQDYQMTEFYEADEQVIQPDTKIQKLSTMTNDETIKTASSVKRKRKVIFTNDNKEVSDFDELGLKPHNKANKQDSVHEQKQTGDAEERCPKPLMMSRAQLYAALSDKPEPDEPRINPNKGKFFFGSTLRLYGGCRWSELRQKAKSEDFEGMVDTRQEFKLAGDNEPKSKWAKYYEPPNMDDDTTILAYEEPCKFITGVEKQAQHQNISAIKRYDGNWKASGPAFIVITNALFMVDL
jgi:hypothetical protein